MSEETMNLPRLLDLIQSERTRWEAALDRITPERMQTLALDGGRSIKDTIAHVAWYEREMLNLLQTRSMAGASPWWGLEQDEQNRMIYEENRARPLNEVRRESATVYQQLLAEIQKLEEAGLHDPSRFDDMPPDWTPWQILAENTYLHYADHANEFEKLLKNP